MKVISENNKIIFEFAENEDTGSCPICGREKKTEFSDNEQGDFKYYNSFEDPENILAGTEFPISSYGIYERAIAYKCRIDYFNNRGLCNGCKTSLTNHINKTFVSRGRLETSFIIHDKPKENLDLMILRLLNKAIERLAKSKAKNKI